MSDYPPPPSPYGGDSAGLPPTHDTGAAGRPGTRGIWIGVVMMVLGVAVLVVGMLVVWKPFVAEDAVFAADGQPHQVDLPADEERGVFMKDGTSATCDAVDADGEQVEFRGMGATSYDLNDWSATNRFDTGAGDVTFTCEATEGTEIRIGPLPNVGAMVVGMLASCGVAVLLGLGGLILLIVTVVRRSRRS